MVPLPQSAHLPEWSGPGTGEALSCGYQFLRLYPTWHTLPMLWALRSSLKSAEWLAQSLVAGIKTVFPSFYQPKRLMSRKLPRTGHLLCQLFPKQETQGHSVSSLCGPSSVDRSTACQQMFCLNEKGLRDAHILWFSNFFFIKMNLWKQYEMRTNF